MKSSQKICILLCAMIFSGCKSNISSEKPPAPSTTLTEITVSESDTTPKATAPIPPVSGTESSGLPEPGYTPGNHTESFQETTPPETIPVVSFPEQGTEDPALPDGTIRTSSQDFREIAQLVLESAYGAEHAQDFLPEYLAKGMINGELWFAVRFTIGDGEEAEIREALMKQDEPEQYSLVTINNRVPIDNLLEDDNCSSEHLLPYLELIQPFQNTGIFGDTFDFQQNVLPTADILVHTAQKLLGEKPEYSRKEILAALSSYFPVTEEYLMSASCFRAETDSYRYSEYSGGYQYALVHGSTEGDLHTITLYASGASKQQFDREILLTIKGDKEKFSLVSCQTKLREIPSYSLPVVIASDVCKTSDGEMLTVTLELTEGHYYEACGQNGQFRHGFRGKYDWVLLQNEEEVFRIPAKLDGLGLLNFPKKFPLTFSDYDKDGNPELALGQWTSFGMEVQLYRIENRSITPIPYDDGMFLLKTEEFSPVFESDETYIYAEIYDKESDSYLRRKFLLTPEGLQAV